MRKHGGAILFSKKCFKVFIILFLLSIPTTILLSNKYRFDTIRIKKVSRFNEDRIAFQHIDIFTQADIDDSVEALLIIKKQKMYLIKDGYDKADDVREKRLLLNMQAKMVDDTALWKNKMNSLPDYIKITDRRVEILTNFTEKFVNVNFGPFYKKVRDSFIKRHVSVFRTLLRNRRESGLYVVRKPLPQPFYLGAKQTETKYYITATAKTKDEKIYYCEDADGDDITETFSVSLPDGFNWGTYSGPNMIFIFKNKSKDLENIIGKLAHESFYGTTEEEKIMLKTFPKESEIIELIDDIVKDEEFYK